MALAETVNRLCLKQLGRLPDLESPTGYNDIIQWLKLHDQRRDHIVACDKIAARGMVGDLAGDDVLVPLLPWAPNRYPCIVKANHDSGSARMIRHHAELEGASIALRRRLARPYGVDKGEWAYAFAHPVIFAEEMLPGEIVDYKFHCAHGQVRWVQVIWNRHAGNPHEAIFLPDGTVTRLHMDEKMVHDPDARRYPGALAWEALTEVAQLLAQPWRYVRVDLYWSRSRPWFGELTFWPRAGCYRSPDEPTFGAMLGLDLSHRYAPIVH